MSEENKNQQDNGDGGGAGTPSGDDATNQRGELAAASEASNAANTRADAATAAYLTACRSANPTIPNDLITGDTIDAINASVTAGQSVVDQVLEANKPDGKEKPPGDNAGAPPRGDRVPPSNLRGISKIADALSHPGQGMTE